VFHSETSYNAAYLYNGLGSRRKYELNSQNEICVVDSATALFF